MLVGGTICLGVVDAEGNAVSLIQSNAAGFGRGVLDPETGVHFQNRGASFSLDPASPNVLEPRQAAAHTLMPGMLFREGEPRPWVVAGSMGGDIQPQIHVELVSALVDGGAEIATGPWARRGSSSSPTAPSRRPSPCSPTASWRTGVGPGWWRSATSRAGRLRRSARSRARDRAGRRRTCGGRHARRHRGPRSPGLPAVR